MKSQDLPLHWFDIAFRRYGALLLLALWAMRAATTLLLAPGAMGAPRAHVWAPCALYAAQAALRALLYVLHYAGKPTPGTAGRV